MDKQTIEKLKHNPHYKPNPAQKKAMEKDEEKIKTFGVVPKQVPTMEKHPTDPKTIKHDID